MKAERLPNNTYTPDSTKAYESTARHIAELEHEVWENKAQLESLRWGMDRTTHDMKVLTAALDRSRETRGPEHPVTKQYEDLIATGQEWLRKYEEIFNKTNALLEDVEVERDRHIEGQNVQKSALN